MTTRHTIPWWRTDFDETDIAAVAAAIRGRRITSGAVTRQFEQSLAELIGVRDAVLTTSGTAALFLALKAAGVGPGDEVIVPAFGFIAPAHAAQLAGARVRLADVRGDVPVIDPGQASRSISDRTRVIVAIHLNGAAADIPALQQLAKDHGLQIVEDGAQALASSGPHGLLGSESGLSAFSLGITKLCPMGEGGFVAARDDDVAESLRRFRNHGVAAIRQDRFETFGFNLRATDFAAALGLSQLQRLPERVQAVCDIYRFYADALADVPGIRILPHRLDDGRIPLWTEVLCEDRDGLLAALERAGIQARPYHAPLSESPHLDCDGCFPNAERFAREGLILPSGPHQHPEDLQRVVTEVRRHLEAVRGNAQMNAVR